MFYLRMCYVTCNTGTVISWRNFHWFRKLKYPQKQRQNVTHIIYYMHDLWAVETIIIIWNYEKFKDTKGLIISVSRRRTDNIMTKRKRTNGQTMIYKTLHIKRSSNMISTKTPGWTQVPGKGTQFAAPHVGKYLLHCTSNIWTN